MNNQELPAGLVEIGDDALEIVANLYHCARTDCKCGAGNESLKEAAIELAGIVSDPATARAYCEGLIFCFYQMTELLPQVSAEVRIHTNLVLCEAMRMGGILTEAQIDAAVAKIAKVKASETGKQSGAKPAAAFLHLNASHREH